ncbi:hypothetical protein WK62_26535 [Burkholderia ubonensis]|nr:hypothetical protein WJ80_31240 [Burkholderia ubonensis]KVU17457.1 hypothetical protein WK62_26535 [Burkholderia ubonensis]
MLAIRARSEQKLATAVIETQLQRIAAVTADMRVPRAAYSGEMRRRAPPRARPRRRDTGFPTLGIEG